MRRATRFILSLLIPLAFVIIVQAVEREQTAAWRFELDRYRAYKYSDSSNGTILRVVQAQQPWYFQQDMSSLVYGDSGHYQTDYGYSNRPSGIYRLPPSPADSRLKDNRKPLPFPPQEVWCVLLEQSRDTDRSGETTTPAVVFVALHQDLYNADWVVHEGVGASVSQESRASLSRIGCELRVDP
ncbi:MAG: hypothetical protein M5U01_26045 [Ardenticatenaceae bacterium]|nr:hypothetical protein [Ardenticatenaceae bacterium]HBY98404.1 hypothetical protein [Chloroflexota bacterium]